MNLELILLKYQRIKALLERGSLRDVYQEFNSKFTKSQGVFFQFLQLFSSHSLKLEL